jgi:nitrile hydratase subunit beta
MTKRAPHDLGGVEPDASAAIDRNEHTLTDFDKSVDALLYLLSRRDRRLIRVDELRRAIEAMPPADYQRLGYYEKWLTAITALLVEKGVLSRAEIDAKLAQLREAA